MKPDNKARLDNFDTQKDSELGFSCWMKRMLTCFATTFDTAHFTFELTRTPANQT